MKNLRILTICVGKKGKEKDSGTSPAHVDAARAALKDSKNPGQKELVVIYDHAWWGADSEREEILIS